MSKEKTFDVVIPFISDPGEFEALRYALRSIEKNLMIEGLRVVIVGELPDFVNPDVVKHIALERVPGVKYANCFDATRKMNAVILDPDTSDDFLLMYDDTYITKSVDRVSIKEGYKMKLPEKINSDRVHGQLLLNTFQALAKVGKHQANIETHTPRLFNKSEMIKTYRAFKPIKNRLLYATLYYNFVSDTDKFKTITKQNKHKIGFYGYSDPWSYASDKPAAELVEKISKYRYLNHDDAGLSENLKEAIETLFPEKSKYEL